MNMNSDNYEDEIDFSFIFSTIWDAKLKIVAITSLFALSSAFYALSIPDKYTSSALLQVQSNSNNSGSSLTSQLGGLASLAGITMPSSGGDKSFYAIETVQSREFLKHLVTFEGVKENLIAAIGYDHELKVSLFDDEIFNPNKNEWLRPETKETKTIPTYLEIYDDVYIQDVLISKDKKSGYILISFEHYSPQFAYNFLNLIIDELNTVSRKKDIEESQKALDYLSEQSKVIDQKNIKNSIQRLVDSQLQRLVLANIKDDYLVTAVDKPFIAEKNSSPSRPIILIIGTIIGLILSLFYFLIKAYVPLSKENI